MSQINAGEFVSIGVGLLVLAYVAYCLINQKFWNRRIKAWGTREEHPKIFKFNIIFGMVIVIWTVVSTFLKP